MVATIRRIAASENDELASASRHRRSGTWTWLATTGILDGMGITLTRESLSNTNNLSGREPFQFCNVGISSATVWVIRVGE
ncbi:hypothetical protein [Planctomycetes bacterium CA13]